MNKQRLYAILLLLSSFMVYLEWAGDNHRFLFQLELEIFQQFVAHPSAIIHPLIIIPLIGQLLLAVSIFSRKASRKIVLIGLFALSVIVLLIGFIGIMEQNFLSIASTLPFLVLGLKFVKEK